MIRAHAHLLHRPDVGPVVDPVRRQRVVVAVAGHERHRRALDLAHPDAAPRAARRACRPPPPRRRRGARRSRRPAEDADGLGHAAGRRPDLGAGLRALLLLRALASASGSARGLLARLGALERCPPGASACAIGHLQLGQGLLDRLGLLLRAQAAPAPRRRRWPAGPAGGPRRPRVLPGSAARPRRRPARLTSVATVWSTTSSTRMLRICSSNAARSSSSVGSRPSALIVTSGLLARARPRLPRMCAGSRPPRRRRPLRMDAPSASARRWRWAPFSSGSAASMPSAARAGRRPGQQPVAEGRRPGTPPARSRSIIRPSSPYRMARQKFSSIRRRGGSVKATPSSWSSAAWATQATISPASAVDSSAPDWASQMRTSTVPKEWCGRTLHHSWVCSTIELVRTSRST